jgi:hypothetical protein
MPVRYTRILTAPTISEWSTEPAALTSRLTLSTTSRNTSFFLCLIPSFRQDTAFVSAVGGLGADVSSLRPVCVMYLRSRCVERVSEESEQR